jgi:cell pole-organizing protein PopZ
MNIKGSGDNGSRACRFQRRISVLLADDPSGDVYQFNVPAKSLFGKGTGNSHPFESYVKYLLGHGESPDNVVTNISFDTNADTMELVFTPLRNLTDEEYELVRAARNKPEAKNYTMITVAQADGVKKQPSAIEAKPKAKAVVTPEYEVEADAPVKRQPKKQETAPAPKQDIASVVSDWAED